MRDLLNVNRVFCDDLSDPLCSRQSDLHAVSLQTRSPMLDTTFGELQAVVGTRVSLKTNSHQSKPKIDPVEIEKQPVGLLGHEDAEDLGHHHAKRPLDKESARHFEEHRSFPSSATTLDFDQKACMILEVRVFHSTGALADISGVYHRNDGRRANGLPVWKKAHSESPVWIYGTKTSGHNAWFIGGLLETQRWERWNGAEFRHDNIVPAYNRAIPKCESTVAAEYPNDVPIARWRVGGKPFQISVEHFEEQCPRDQTFGRFGPLAKIQHDLNDLVAPSGSIAKIDKKVSDNLGLRSRMQSVETLRRDEQLLQSLRDEYECNRRSTDLDQAIADIQHDLSELVGQPGQSLESVATPVDLDRYLESVGAETGNFELGEIVEMKDENEEEWHRGEVTSLRQLKVRVLQPYDTGLELPGLVWDSVRKMQSNNLVNLVKLKCEFCYSPMESDQQLPRYFSGGPMLTATGICSMCLDRVYEVKLGGDELNGLLDCLDQSCMFRAEWTCPKSGRVIPPGSHLVECNKDFHAARILKRLQSERAGVFRLEIQLP